VIGAPVITVLRKLIGVLFQAQSIQFVLGIELRQHLIGVDAAAYVRQPFDDPATDAEGQGAFLLSQDLSCENDRLTKVALLGDHGTDRTRRRWLGCGFARAPCGRKHERRRARRNSGVRRFVLVWLLNGDTTRSFQWQLGLAGACFKSK
jgi:hypothetical protein